MFPRPPWAIPSAKLFQTLPVFLVLSTESIPLQKIDPISSLGPEVPVTTPQITVSIVNDTPVRAQTPPPEIPTIRKKISTPCFTRPSTPSRPGTPITRPSTPVDVRSSLPHPQKSSLSNALSGSFASVKRSPSVRDFLGTAANFAKEAKPKSVPQKKTRNASTTSISSDRSAPSNETIDCPYIAREKQKLEKQKQMALVQYHSPVIQLPLFGPIQNGTLDAYDASSKEPSYTASKQVQQNFLGFTSYIKPSKETFGISIDRALISQYLERLQKKAAKVQSHFSPAVPNINVSTSQQSSLVRINRAFGKHRSLDSQSGPMPEIYIDPRYRSYVHHFFRKSVWKTAAVGSSRSIKEVMQELRKGMKLLAPPRISCTNVITYRLDIFGYHCPWSDIASIR